MLRTKHVRAGAWRTLEWFWNQKATAFFGLPAGAIVKVRYGDGWPFGWNRQRQTLDGEDIKRLTIGLAAVAYARLQMRVPADTNVTYDVYPGEIVARPRFPLDL